MTYEGDVRDHINLRKALLSVRKVMRGTWPVLPLPQRGSACITFLTFSSEAVRIGETRRDGFGCPNRGPAEFFSAPYAITVEPPPRRAEPRGRADAIARRFQART